MGPPVARNWQGSCISDDGGDDAADTSRRDRGGAERLVRILLAAAFENAYLHDPLLRAGTAVGAEVSAALPTESSTESGASGRQQRNDVGRTRQRLDLESGTF
jgi:hypothetical protein